MRGSIVFSDVVSPEVFTVSTNSISPDASNHSHMGDRSPWAQHRRAALTYPTTTLAGLSSRVMTPKTAAPIATRERHPAVG